MIPHGDSPIPPDLWQALLDPTAPLPSGWPTGGWGAFLLFLFPVGGGIPAGVLLAQNDGVPPLGTAALYLISDIVLAFTTEPFLAFLRWLARWVPLLARMGHVLERLSTRAGLRAEGAQGPLELILVSFAVSPTTGRAAAAAAGHGFIPGWALAITGDMGYFGLLMVSTLWVSTVLGNDRLTIGVMLGLTLLLPVFLGRLRQIRSNQEERPVVASTASVPLPAGTQRLPRKQSRAQRKAVRASRSS